jgi:hypothetical protein
VTVKLLFADIMRVIEDENLVPDWVPLIQKAERYLFETYGDVDEDTVKAISDTAHEMIEYGLFHLPHPVIWLEDPWPDDWVDRATGGAEWPGGRPPHGSGAQVYLLQELPDRITWTLIVATPNEHIPGKRFYNFHIEANSIPLDASKLPTDWRSEIGSTNFAIKQFVVTLATEQAVVERKISGGYGSSVPKTRRNLDYTDVRIVIPGERGEPGTGPEGHHGKRRLHLVAGYMWGKHTRPRDEQRWTAPFWRGDRALGVVGHDHYEVRRRQLPK